MVFCVFPFLGFSQQAVQKNYSKYGQVSFAAFDPACALSDNDPAAFLSDFLHLRTGEAFVLEKTVTDKAGGKHQRLRQTYSGLPVYGAMDSKRFPSPITTSKTLGTVQKWS